MFLTVETLDIQQENKNMWLKDCSQNGGIHKEQGNKDAELNVIKELKQHGGNAIN